MTKIRRAAQLVGDLATLGVINKGDVRTSRALDGGISVKIDGVIADNSSRYYLIRDAFEEEFSKDCLRIITDSTLPVQFVIEK